MGLTTNPKDGITRDELDTALAAYRQVILTVMRNGDTVTSKVQEAALYTALSVVFAGRKIKKVKKVKKVEKGYYGNIDPKTGQWDGGPPDSGMW